MKAASIHRLLHLQLGSESTAWRSVEHDTPRGEPTVFSTSATAIAADQRRRRPKAPVGPPTTEVRHDDVRDRHDAAALRPAISSAGRRPWPGVSASTHHEPGPGPRTAPQHLWGRGRSLPGMSFEEVFEASNASGAETILSRSAGSSTLARSCSAMASITICRSARSSSLVEMVMRPSTSATSPTFAALLSKPQ